MLGPFLEALWTELAWPLIKVMLILTSIFGLLIAFESRRKP